MRNSKTMSTTTLLCHGRILKRVVGAFKRQSQISSNSVLEMQKGCDTSLYLSCKELNLNSSTMEMIFWNTCTIEYFKFLMKLFYIQLIILRVFLDLFKVLTSRGKSVGTSKLIHFFSQLRWRHFIYVFVYVPLKEKWNSSTVFLDFSKFHKS